MTSTQLARAKRRNTSPHLQRIRTISQTKTISNSSLLALPRELRDEIIDYVVNALRPAPNLDQELPGHLEGRRGHNGCYYETSEGATRPQFYGLVWANHQLRAETLERAGKVHVPYKLDILVFDSSHMLFTWLSIPYQIGPMVGELCINVRFQKSSFDGPGPSLHALELEDKVETFLNRFLAFGPSRVKIEHGMLLEPRYMIKSIVINIDPDPFPEDDMNFYYDSDDVEDFEEFFTEVLFDLNEEFEVYPGRVGRLAITLSGETIRDWNLSQILASNSDSTVEGSGGFNKRPKSITTSTGPGH